MTTIDEAGDKGLAPRDLRNRIAFALDVARLVTELERLADRSRGRDPEAAAAAESYLDLLCRLGTIDGEEEIVHAVTRAVETFDEARRETGAAQVRVTDLRAARSLAAQFGAYLFCQCGREKIGDDGTCPRCAEEER
jgi:hypothetical protein